MTEYVGDTGTDYMEWESQAPDLGSAFPSLAQQIKEYPAIESGLSEAAYAPENSSGLDGNVPSDSNSEWQLILTGASYHIGAREYIDKDNGQFVDFNEVNPGIGIQRAQTDNISLAVGVYENSYNETSVYGYVSLESDPLTETGKVTVGVDAGVISGYDGYIDERLMIGDSGFAMMVSPFVSVDISGASGGLLPDGTNLKANFIPGEAMLGSDDPNAVDAAVGVSMRMPF